jgi:flavin reductase (DIM6/NTAB) family NADH-FMN oxidoreductase RutF
LFYEADKPHGLPHDPLKSCVAPRPIGWISTISADGIANLAPYSFFNGISVAPFAVMFASNGPQPHGPKDTITNVEETGEFVVNMATWDLREKVNLTSAPLLPEVDEFVHAGLTTKPSKMVKPPRVGESPIHLECVYMQTVDLPSDNPEFRNAMVLGRVVGVHIADDMLTDGLVDTAKLRPLSRMGYMEYAVIDDVFTMARPE